MSSINGYNLFNLTKFTQDIPGSAKPVSSIQVVQSIRPREPFSNPVVQRQVNSVRQLICTQKMFDSEKILPYSKRWQDESPESESSELKRLKIDSSPAGTSPVSTDEASCSGWSSQMEED
jgi:hypothetical protein